MLQRSSVVGLRWLASGRRKPNPKVKAPTMESSNQDSTDFSEAASDSIRDTSDGNPATAAGTSRVTMVLSELVQTRYRDRLTQMNKEIIKCANNVRSDQTLKPFKVDTHPLISHLICDALNTNATFIPIGSCANGLRMDSSDVDLAFYVHDQNSYVPFLRNFHHYLNFAEHFMDTLSKLIARSAEKIGVTVENAVAIVRSTRVPIIKLKFSDGLNLDIQVPTNAFHAIRNTHLIRAYVQSDPRMLELYIWLRTVLSSMDVLNSPYGLLSSYHVAILTIHFLQSEQCLSPWPVLPTICKLYPETYGHRVPIAKIVEMLKEPPTFSSDWKTNNKMRVAELAVRLVDYYSTFSYKEYAIFIEKGMCARRNHYGSNPTLQLYDPYSKESVCRSYWATLAFFEAIAFIKKKMQHGRMLDSFPTFPEATFFREETRWSKWRTMMEFNKNRLQKGEMDL